MFDSLAGRRWAGDIRSRKLNVPIVSDYAADGIGLLIPARWSVVVGTIECTVFMTENCMRHMIMARGMRMHHATCMQHGPDAL